MIESPQILQTDAIPYAFLHLTVPRAEMHAILPPALTQLFAEVKAQGLPIVPWFAHHMNLGEGDFDFEACIPVDETFLPTGRVQRGVWPAGTVARTVYHGDYAGLYAAWRELSGWIREQDQRGASHIYEHYVVNQRTVKDPAAYRTVLSWPLLTPAAEGEQA